MVETLKLNKKDGPVTDFAYERNLMLSKSVSEWVLFIDSDEKVSPELEREISALDFKKDGYFIKRKDYFMGKFLKFGETDNIKLLRLGKKNLPAGRQGTGKWIRKVHEYWDIKNTGELKNPILHYPVSSIFELVKKINYYSEIDAGEFKYFSYPEVIVKPIGKFIQNYFLRLGFLDGMAGFVKAYMMAFQSMAVRVKQYENYKTS